MTYLSCFGIGVAFVLAVGLLLFAAVLLGFAIPVRRRPPPVPEERRERRGG